MRDVLSFGRATQSAGAAVRARFPAGGVERTGSNSSTSLLSIVRSGSAAAVAAAAAAMAGNSGTPRTPVTPGVGLCGSRTNSSPSAIAAALAAETGPLRLRKTNSSGPGKLPGQQQQQGQPPLAAATVSTLVDVLWRPLLAGLSSVLSRCCDGSRHEALMLQVRGAHRTAAYMACQTYCMLQFGVFELSLQTSSSYYVQHPSQ
jgi:hypothetical protein